MTIFTTTIYILLTCFIIGMAYYNTLKKESFYSREETIVLLGDSILKNNEYVEKGIDEILIERTEKTYCYAEDGAKIVDVYSQLDRVPFDLNNKLTTVYLSVGGNNILTHYVDLEQDITDTNILFKLFSSYVILVESIQTKMQESKLVLLDIYYPQSEEFKKYHSIIREWNNMIYHYAEQNHNEVLKVSQLLTQEGDFSHSIEPSLQGGEKIVNYILTPYAF